MGGLKKIYYFMEKDITRLLRKKMDAIQQKEINPAKIMLPKLLDKYKIAKLSSEDKKKREIIVNYHKEILKIEKLITEFNKHLETA